MADNPFSRLLGPGLAPKKSGARGGVRLVSTYGSGFGPNFANTQIGAGEREALNTLYGRHTGGDLSSHPDPAVALRESGLLHPITSSRGAAVARHPRLGGRTYASAVDALDSAVSSVFAPHMIGPDILGMYKKAVLAKHPEVREGVKSQPSRDYVREALSWYRGRVEANNPQLRSDTGGATVGDLLGRYRSAVEAKHPEVRIGKEKTLPEAFSGVLGAYKGAIEAKHPELPKKEIGFGDLPAGTFLNFGSPFSKEEESRLATLGGRVTGTHLGGLIQTYEIPGYKLRNMQKSVDPVRNYEDPHRVAVIASTAKSIIESQATASAASAMAAFFNGAFEGLSSSDLDQIQKTGGLGPLDGKTRKRLIDLAKMQGWEISNPRQYTDADLAHRAFTKANGEWFWTGLYRGVAGLTSLPAFFAAAIESSVDAAQGDPDPMKGLIRQGLAPFTYYWNDVGRRGVRDATESFVKERPFDAITIVNGAVRAFGRGAAIGMRTAGGTGRGIVQTSASDVLGAPAEGSLRARAGEYARVGRPVQATFAGPNIASLSEDAANVLSREGDRVSVTVGVTGKNILDTIALGTKAWLVQKAIESGGRGIVGRPASRLARKSIERAIRNVGTQRDIASARVVRELVDVGRALTPAQRERLAMELLRSTVDLEGNALSVADAGAFWRGEAQRALADSAEATDLKKQGDLRRDAQLYKQMADEYDRIAGVPLEQSVIDQAKAIAAPIGRDNDMYIASVIDALHEGADARGVKVIASVTDEAGNQRPMVASDLRPGHYIDPTRFSRRAQKTEEYVPYNPAVVTDVRITPKGVYVAWESVADPSITRTVLLKDATRRVQRLSSGVTPARYIRDFITLRDQLNQMVSVTLASRRAAAREATAVVNAPTRSLMKLDERRQSIGRQLAIIVEKMNEARASGSQSKTRRYTKQFSRKAYELRAVLVQMEKEARAADIPELADWARARIDEIKIERGDLGGTVSGLDATRQSGILRAIEENQVAPVVERFVEQPRAAALLGRAAGLEKRAAELYRLEQELVAERAAAPTARASLAASRRLEEIRAEIASLTRMSGEARRRPGGFAAALDDLESRFDYLRTGRFVDFLPVSSKWVSSFNAARPELLRTLGELRQKLDDGAIISSEDVALLRSAEATLVGLERRAKATKAYRDMRKAGVAEPANFGSRAASKSVNEDLASELVGQARAAEERMVPLEETVAARAAAPAAEGIRGIRQTRKQALRAAAKNRREAARIIERGRPLVSDRGVRVVMDAATDEIAVDLRMRLAQPVRFKIDRVRGELRHEFIARAEMLGEGPTLWLGTRQGRLPSQASIERITKEMDLSPGAGLSRGRLNVNTGATYAAGAETFSNLWRKLISDTGAVSGNAAWLREMRRFLDGISVLVTNMTEKEAAAYNAVRNGTIANINTAEAVVFDAREWVAISADRRYPVSRAVVTGAADLGETARKAQDTLANEVVGDATTMQDLFNRVATVEDVVNAGGSYYLVPKILYDQIVKELADIEYRPTSGIIQFFDKLTKWWRSFTLNVFPRTAFANLVGSCALAALAGAGPRSFYYAYRHLKYGDIPAPAQLRQGFGASLTTDVEFARLRAALPSASLRIPGYPRRFVPGVGRELSLDTPFAALAYWMNTMRKFNGVTEDFGRLAVWYSKAYPEASRLAQESNITMWTRGRELSKEAQNVLEHLARGDDPNTAAIAQSFVDRSFEWLGDLHSGGKLNTRLRIAVPFQQWYRHIVRLTLITMPLKYPGRTLMLQRMGDIGREYLQEHGIFPAWMMDVIPILIDEKMLDGIPQEYIMAWHAGNANPFGTVGGAVSNERQQFTDWAAGMLNPMIRNLAEVVYSAATGEAKKLGGDTGFQYVRNQANNNIKTFSSDGYAWMLNELQRAMPLSSLAVTSSGQAAEGNIFFGGAPKLLRGSEGFMPAYASPPETPGRDFAQLATDFTFWNAIALTARSLVGGSAAYAIGRGPVQDSQFAAMIGRMRRNYIREMNNIEKSQYQLEQTNPNPAPIVTSQPSEPQATTTTLSFDNNAYNAFTGQP